VSAVHCSKYVTSLADGSLKAACRLISAQSSNFCMEKVPFAGGGDDARECVELSTDPSL
jgi:hypothetical protein